MRTRHGIWGIWLFLLLAVPATMWAAGWRPNQLPGTDTTSPEVDVGRLLDEDYYREIDDWLAVGSPARDVGLWARYQVDYRLLGDSTSGLVAVGADGWLFSRSFVDVSCDTIDAIRAPVVPEDRDDQVTYLVPFAKVYWLEHLLEPHDRPPACSRQARDDLRARLTADPRGFDINTAFDDDPMAAFYPRDPHWGPIGRVRAAEALVERLAPGLWDPSAVFVEQETTTQGMTRFLGSNDTETREGRYVDRGAELVVEDQAFGLGLLVWQRSTSSGVPVIPGTTYMFGDSQGASLVPYLEQYFEELVFIGWLRTGLGPLPLDSLPPPDRLIVEAIDQWADTNFTNPAIAEVAARLPPDVP